MIFYEKKLPSFYFYWTFLVPPQFPKKSTEKSPPYPPEPAQPYRAGHPQQEVSAPQSTLTKGKFAKVAPGEV